MTKHFHFPCLALFLFAILLAGCDRQDLAYRFSTVEDRALAIETLRAIQRSDVAALEAIAHPEVRPRIRGALNAVRAQLPVAKQRSARLVEARAHQELSGNRQRQSLLTYEIGGGGEYALARIGILQVGESAFVTDLFINRVAQAESERHAFSLSGRSPLHYVFVIATIGAFLLSLYGIYLVWRSGAFRRRILWTLACAVGIFRISLNWTSGDVFFAPMTIQLFSASFFSGGLLMPWIISFSLPAGAICVIVLARAHIRNSRSAEKETFA